MDVCAKDEGSLVTNPNVDEKYVCPNDEGSLVIDSYVEIKLLLF